MTETFINEFILIITMLELNEIVPKKIKNRKVGSKYKLHITTDEIPGENKKLRRDKIGIWYETRTPTGGRVVYSSILPRFIKEDTSLYESVGLYLAEGASDTYSLIFGNDEPKVINTFLKTFHNHFKVPFSNWTWSVCFNDKLREKEGESETERRERSSINFWLKKTKIHPLSASKTPFRYSNKNSDGKLRSGKHWGSLSVVYGNRILKCIWNEIMDSLTKKVLRIEDRSGAASILRGWIAGDGYCKCKIYDKPRRELSVACKDEEKLPVLYKLFNLLEIEPYERKNGPSFTKAEYLVKAYNSGLTSLHFPKHRNLLKSLLNYRRIPRSIERINQSEVKEELNVLKGRIKRRRKLFESLKDEEIPKLKEKVNWQFLMSGLLLKTGMSPREFGEEIGCAKGTVENWLQGAEPSRKYKDKILKRSEKYKNEKLTRTGKFFLEGNWQHLLEGM